METVVIAALCYAVDGVSWPEAFVIVGLAMVLAWAVVVIVRELVGW